MKKVFLIVLLLTFISCEEVIEVDIDNAAPRIVIEAGINDGSEGMEVIIKKSIKFDQNFRYDVIVGADISIIGDDGSTQIVEEIHPGWYPTFDNIAIPGVEYQMIIEVDGKFYSAKSTMPKRMTIDRISAVSRTNPINNKIEYDLHCYFQDHPGIKDYARFSISINKNSINRVFTYDDRLTDGKFIDYNRFFLDSEIEIKPGDEVHIFMYTIDKATFNYFESLKNAIASSGVSPLSSIAPANPIAIWDNGALGYFSAYSRDHETIIIE